MLLPVVDDEDDETRFPVLIANFDEDATTTFRFADVDRLLIRNMPVASLSKWLQSEVELANRRAFVQSDPIIKLSLLIVTSPIFLLIEPTQKDIFAESMCKVCFMQFNV